MKQVFRLSPLFKEGEGGNLFEIMAWEGGRHLFREGGFFRDTQYSHFQKCHLSLSTNKYHDCKLL